jgi:uncharacterized protein YbjT (DUF2867 family)
MTIAVTGGNGEFGRTVLQALGKRTSRWSQPCATWPTPSA